LGITADDTCPDPDMEAWLAERDLMNRLLQQHLHRVQQRMKAQADKNHSERSFSMDDMVFIRLQAYVQASIAPCAHHKLMFKYYGPYRVLARVGEVVYHLELPETRKIHLVVHVS
jgi:hypothetical protein